MNLNLLTRNDLLVLPDIETPEDRSIERKRLRRNQILNIIRINGPISHSEIARRAGVNLRTVKSHIEELMENGLIYEDEHKEKTMGRPAPLNLIQPKGFCFLGLSFTDDKVSFAFMGLDCRVLHSASHGLDPDAPAASRVDAARKFLLSEISPIAHDLPPLAGLILATPDHEFTNGNYFGLVFPKAGTWQAALFRMLTAEFQVPILMENQGRLDAVASLWFGAGQSRKSFCYLSMGSHPRVTLIEDTRIHYGYLGQAGDLASLVDPTGNPYSKLVSTKAILNRAAKKGMEVDSIRALAELARAGKKEATAFFRELSGDIARLSAVTASIYSPEGIILGGNLGDCADLMETTWKEQTHRLLPERLSLRLELEFCPLAGQSPELGPVAFGFHHLFHGQRMHMMDLF